MAVSNLNIKIDIQGELNKIEVPRNNRISRDKIIKSINNTMFDDEVKRRLIIAVNDYPDAALPQFLAAKHSILAAIIKTREIVEMELEINESRKKKTSKDS